MWKCPVCVTENNEQKNGNVCAECGFDQSLNYESYPTLLPVDEATCKTLDEYRTSYKLVSLKYTCEKCSNKLFFYVPDSGQLICSKCGTELQLNIHSNAKTYYKDGECPLNLLNDNMQEKFYRFPNKPYFFTAVSAGQNHYVALRKNGTVYAYGANDNGQCDVENWKDITYVCANSQNTFGITKDKGIVIAGKTTSDFSMSNWKSVVSLSVRDDYALGLNENGAPFIIGKLPFTVEDTAKWLAHGRIATFSAGLKHSVALLTNGTVVAIGDNTKGQCNTSEKNNQPWQNVIAISAGDYHTLALKSDGTVYAAGDNSNGQCDVSDLKHIVAISAGSRHSVFLAEDGSLIIKGKSLANQEGIRIKHDIIAISAYGDNTVALLPNDRIQKAPTTK